ncbi:hypothetical protein D9M71_731680 [compost metagenome]
MRMKSSEIIARAHGGVITHSEPIEAGHESPNRPKPFDYDSYKRLVSFSRPSIYAKSGNSVFPVGRYMANG